MIALKRRTFWGRLARLWPPERRRRDEAFSAAIRHLVDNPAEPFKLDGVVVHSVVIADAGKPGPQRA